MSEMDFESEMVDRDRERPDNLVWIEQVILDNLDVDPALLDVSSDLVSTSTQAAHAHEKKKEEHELKLMIAEIEMRDETYFGDDRIKTLSRLVAARIKYIVEGEDEERNHYWIIKIPSVHPQERDLARCVDVYRREICFYTDILPAMKLWVDSQYIDQLIEFQVPACYYGKFLRQNDPEPDLELLDHILEAESLLVLEDLRASDFGKRYFGKGMELSEVFAAVQEIAKFHAVSYAMQTKTNESLHWKELFHWSDFVKFYQTTFTHGFEVFKNFMSNRAKEPDSDKILEVMNYLNSKAGNVLKGLMAPSSTFPSTLIHMDLWSDNLLFKVKDEDADVPLEDADIDCAIIDWQMVSLGKPSHDLALLVILSMDPDLRREHSHLILQFYFELFEKMLSWFDIEMPYTFDILIVEFSNSCLLSMMMSIASMDLVLMEETAQDRLIEVIRDLIQDDILKIP